MNIKITHLFPRTLNLFSDKGNLAVFKNRLLRRGMGCEIFDIDFDGDMDFKDTDIVLLGGGSERALFFAAKQLLKSREKLMEYIDGGGVMLALCGGFPLLGTRAEICGEMIDGAGILNIETINAAENKITEKFSGDVVLSTTLFKDKIVGFENHTYKVYINEHQPLGTVVLGFGNNGEDKTEGVIYKNLIGTNMHGPLLPKNPALCDFLLSNALKNKYGDDFIGLEPLDDTLENAANEYICSRVKL